MARSVQLCGDAVAEEVVCRWVGGFEDPVCVAGVGDGRCGGVVVVVVVAAGFACDEEMARGFFEERRAGEGMDV